MYHDECIGEFARRMQGNNDTLLGIIKDVLKKGHGQNLTHNLPHLVSWIEKEVNDELNRGYQVALECESNINKICDIWHPEVEAYSIVVYTLDRFVRFSRNEQQRIAGGIEKLKLKY